MRPLLELSGKVCLVIGATSGIGGRLIYGMEEITEGSDFAAAQWVAGDKAEDPRAHCAGLPSSEEA